MNKLLKILLPLASVIQLVAKALRRLLGSDSPKS